MPPAAPFNPSNSSFGKYPWSCWHFSVYSHWQGRICTLDLLVQKQGLKSPILLAGAGSASEKGMVLCGVLFFHVVSSLYTGVSEAGSEMLLKGVDWDPGCLCLLLPRSPSLFTHPSQGDIFKRSFLL